MPICSYCRLETYPLAYHEGQADCVDALFSAHSKEALQAIMFELNDLRNRCGCLSYTLKENEKEIAFLRETLRIESSRGLS